MNAWLAAVSRRTLLALVGGLLGLTALGAAGWFWYVNEQHRAMEAYAQALAALRTAQSPQAAPEAKSAAVRALEAVLARFPSAAAAPQAAYELAGLRYDVTDYAAARGAYEVVLARGGRGTLATLARAGIGHTWEAVRDYAKAIEVYTAALARLGAKDFYYEALLVDLGRAQELAGKKADATATYQRVLKELPQARRAEDVRARLLSLGGSFR